MEIYVKLILSFNVSDMDFLNQTLLKNIKNSISEIVPKKKIGVAFSGGVDSTLVSKICSDMGFDVVLLTIVFSKHESPIFFITYQCIIIYHSS